MADTEANLLWAAKGILPKAQGMNPHVDPDTYPEQTERLAEGVRNATMIGLPLSGPHANKAAFRPLLLGGLHLWGGYEPYVPRDSFGELTRERMLFCDCLVHYYLVIGGFFWGLLKGQRLLVMNDDPACVAQALRGEIPYANGLPAYHRQKLMATCATVIDGPGIDKFVENASAFKTWDVALVGAGARKMAIIPELAESTGKVVLDMGKVLDRLWRPVDSGIWEKMAKLYEEEG
jgi:hypothetical protein